MKYCFSLLALTLITWSAAAQILPRHSGAKLSWDDFETRDSSGILSSQLFIHWNMEKRETRVGDLPILYSVYTAEVHKDYSWVAEECRTPEELAINQTLYEMAESYANALTDSVLFSHADADRVFECFFEGYTKAVQTFRETGIATFPYPEEKVWDLEDLDWKRPSKGCFLGAGLTKDFLLGPAKDLIAPSAGFQVFVGRTFGDNAIMLDGELGRSKNLLRYSNWQGTSTHHSVPHVCVSAKYVRQLPRIGHFQINTFAGLGYSWRGLSDVYTGDDGIIRGPTASEGISVDFFPVRSLRLLGGGPRYSEFGIEIKVYSDQVWLPKTMALMPSLNFMLGVKLPTGLIDRPAFKQ